MARREAFGKPGALAARGFSMAFYRGLDGRQSVPEPSLAARVGQSWLRVTQHWLSLPSILQLALERLDLLGKGSVIARQIFDFAHGVKHRGVITSAEASADFRQ